MLIRFRIPDFPDARQKVLKNKLNNRQLGKAAKLWQTTKLALDHMNIYLWQCHRIACFPENKLDPAD